jgi:hypothetical protein
VKRPGCAAVLGGALLCNLLGCGSGPSKSQAFEAIQNGVKEEGSCTLSVDMLKQLKVQHSTKAMCAPKEGADKARACLDALVTAGATHRMPDGYMLGWPDEVATASLSDIPAYERRPRNLVFGTCVELVGDLRDGRFTCADVRAEKVIKITSADPTHASVRYERDIKLRPTLPAVDQACGTVTRPPGESTVAFEKNASGWVLASAGADAGPN